MTCSRFILAEITREYQISNQIEAGLWIVLGTVAAVQSFRVAKESRVDLIVLALTLGAFGISDLVEAQTGAWWKPLWLLLWKGLCLAIMLGLLLRYVPRRR